MNNNYENETLTKKEVVDLIEKSFSNNAFSSEKAYLELIDNVKNAQTKHDPNHEQIYENALEKAKELINNFCVDEYGGGADFTDLHDVGIAYTTYTDDEKEFQVTADLIDCKIIYEYDGETVKTEQYKDIDDMIKNGLTGLDFDELVSLPDDINDKVYIQEAADRFKKDTGSLINTVHDFYDKVYEGEKSISKKDVAAVLTDPAKASELATQLQTDIEGVGVDTAYFGFSSDAALGAVKALEDISQSLEIDFSDISINWTFANQTNDAEGNTVPVYNANLIFNTHNEETNNRLQYNLMKRIGLDVELQKKGIDIKSFEDFKEMRKPEEGNITISLRYFNEPDSKYSSDKIYATYNSNLPANNNALTFTAREQESFESFYESKLVPDMKRSSKAYSDYLKARSDPDFDNTLFRLNADVAKSYIDAFNVQEYNKEADFSDLHNVSIAHIVDNSGKELQITANFFNAKISYSYDDKVYKTEKYNDVKDMIDKKLKNFMEYFNADELINEAKTINKAFIVELDYKGTYERFALTESDFKLEYPDTDIDRIREGDTDTIAPLVHIWAKEVTVGDNDWKDHFTDMENGLPDSDIENGNLAYVNFDKCSAALEEAARDTAFHLDFSAISIEDSSFDRDYGETGVYTAVLADNYHDQNASDGFQFDLMKRSGLDMELLNDGVEVKNFEDFKELRKPEELGLKIELLYTEYGDQEETVSARALYGSQSSKITELTLTSREQESLDRFYDSDITPDKAEVMKEYDKEID